MYIFVEISTSKYYIGEFFIFRVCDVNIYFMQLDEAYTYFPRLLQQWLMG